MIADIRKMLEEELISIISGSTDDSVKVQAIGMLAKMHGLVGPERKHGNLKTGVRICTDKSKADEKPFEPGEVIVEKTRIPASPPVQ